MRVSPVLNVRSVLSYVLEDLHPVSAPYSSLSQPIPMDMSGDLKIDLFGTLPTSSPDSRFKVWQNVWNDSQSSSPVFNLCVVILPARLYIKSRMKRALFTYRMDPKMIGPQCKLSNPHSNAAVDLNGDCLAGRIFHPSHCLHR